MPGLNSTEAPTALSAQLIGHIDVMLGAPTYFTAGRRVNMRFLTSCGYTETEIVSNSANDTVSVVDENGRNVTGYDWWGRPGTYSINVASLLECPVISTTKKAPTNLVALDVTHSANTAPNNLNVLRLRLESVHAPTNLIATTDTLGSDTAPTNLSAEEMTFTLLYTPANLTIVEMPEGADRAAWHRIEN